MLEGISSHADSICILTRWELQSPELHFDVVDHAGIKHQTPDVFSRLLMATEDHSTPKDDLPILTIVTTDCECDDVHATAAPGEKKYSDTLDHMINVD